MNEDQTTAVQEATVSPQTPGNNTVAGEEGAGDIPGLPERWDDGDALMGLGTSGQEEEGIPEELQHFIDEDGAALQSLTDTNPEDREAPPSGKDNGEAAENAGKDNPPSDIRHKPRMLSVDGELINLDDMDDSALGSLIRKGRAYDGLANERNAGIYRQVYQQQVDAGMTDVIARMAARDAAGGRDYPLDGPASAGAAPVEPTTQGVQRASIPSRDYRSEVEQLHSLFPELSAIPAEVVRTAGKGVPLVTAYLVYQAKESSKKSEALERENATLRQNAAAAAKAPVKGIGSGNGARGKDLFEQGFDAGMGW